ncbi:MAG: hypothetical protein JSW48_14955 [Betaproteobacteria bacterium]|nr:MAG: hypothetical protein JSW48_14955 [Betaproteobacteria bacterium]
MAGIKQTTHQKPSLAGDTNAQRLTASRPVDAVSQLCAVGAQLDAIQKERGLRLVERIDMVGAADWQGAELASELQARFLANGKETGSDHQARVWEAVSSYLARVESVYIFLVRLFQTYSRGWAEVGDRLPLVIARALRATAQRMKWMRMRYRPIDADAWETLSRLWSYVEDKELARARVMVYDERSTLQREFTKPLMFAMSAVDSLPPAEIDMAYRLISHLAGRFEVHRHAAAGCFFVMDIDQWTEPDRYRPGSIVRLGSRFFGPADAVADIETISAELAAGTICSADIGLKGVTDLELIIDVLAHLERHWSATRRVRREQRRPIFSPVSVVLGYAPTMARIKANYAADAGNAVKPERWAVANESEAGYGALVPTKRGKKLHVGQFVGVQPARSRVWAVGIIRRLLAQDSAQYYVGIELLGRGVQLVDLSKRSGREMSGTALLLPSHIGDSLAQAELNLLLPRGAFLPDEPLEMSVYDTTYSITPLMVLEAGDGFEIGRFRINDRAA